MPYKSQAQAAFMQAAANNKDFAKRVGVSQSVAQKFVQDSNNKILNSKGDKKK